MPGPKFVVGICSKQNTVTPLLLLPADTSMVPGKEMTPEPHAAAYIVN